MMNIVTFNGVSIPNFVIVTGVTFDAIGDISIQELNVPMRIGGIDNGVTRGGKNIQLTCKIVKKDKSIHEYADELKQWLKGNEWRASKLTLSEQPGYYYMARALNSVSIDDLYAVGETTIDFYASDPVKYKEGHSEKTSKDGVLEFSYRGVEDSPLSISFTALLNMEGVSFTQLNTGRTTSLSGSIKSGDTIEIDSDKKVVKVNGKTNMNLLSLSNDWLYGSRGLNIIREPSGVANLKVKYQERM